MVEITTTQLYNWVSAFIWPLVRILGVFSSAPLLSNTSFPMQTRLGLGVAMTVLVAPNLPAFPEHDPLSWVGILILTQQFMIGIAIGFVLRIIFTGVELAGEMIGMTMGLGFATFFDPQSKGHSSAISQLLSFLTLLIFITSNLHLLLIETLVDSFHSLPIGVTSLDTNSFQQIAYYGSRLFSLGFQLSLPIITTLMITNMALAVLTRAAPQLNLFAIGFPITFLAGYLMLYVLLPSLTTPIYNMLQEGLQMIRQIILTVT
ncbi:MAG: flagellar biosynthetic protein FliR [Pseudomonadota bacterium]|jgi:flagellar biosynthetic protein FliR